MGFLLAQVEASPFYGRLAQSARPNRVCFRYGRLCSPSVAPHPASRRRSYGWLQAGVGLPEEDLHLPGQNALTSALGATLVVAPIPGPDDLTSEKVQASAPYRSQQCRRRSDRATPRAAPTSGQ